MSRKTTEEQLETAALSLLREHGVLAGLNLRAVADKAGVNRGNVYHYFGSRRQLLQSALRRRLEVNYRTVTQQVHSTLRDQVAWMFKYLIRESEPVQLAALLVLDGDSRVNVMAFLEHNVKVFKELQDQGEIRDDIDLVALQVLVTATTRGYTLHRKNLARQAGVSMRELDERTLGLFLEAIQSLSSAGQEVAEPSR